MKRLVILLLIIAANFNLVYASNHTEINTTLGDISSVTGAIDLAYECLENEIEGKSSLSLQEAIFGTLALGSKSKLNDVISDEEGDNCWPKSSCKVKETAQVLLAKERSGGSTDDIVSWLLENDGSAEDLIWFLQIDIENKISSECTVRYRDTEKSIDVNEDLTLTGGGGTCLSVSNSGFWLEIDESCFDDTFEITCDEDFITALIYQKKNGNTIFVTGETNSAASSGTTEEKVNAKCFLEGNDCNYEGSLWAALTLNEVGESVDSYLPYLLALADDERKFFPEAFLHLLTGGDDQYSEVTQSQKSGGFWETNGPYSKFYDTSLGMLSLSGGSEYGIAQNYLLEIQGNNGCWNNDNIRDTGFLLYSGWPRGVSRGGGGGGALCGEAGHFCEIQSECLNANGVVLGEFECGIGRVCCSKEVQEVSCLNKGGIICPTGQECSGNSVSSLDGSCCIGSCQVIAPMDTCTPFGVCRSTCDSDEEQVTGICPRAGEVCCEDKANAGGSQLWLWILIGIGILLVVLAIIFRNKIRVAWFKFRKKAKVRPLTGESRPRLPPGMAPRRLIRRRPVARRSLSKSDRELEDTMRKLRDIGK
jgi:hypothetical protein